MTSVLSVKHTAVLKFACVPWTAHFKTAYPLKTYPGQRISKKRTPQNRTPDSAFQRLGKPNRTPGQRTPLSAKYLDRTP